MATFELDTNNSWGGFRAEVVNYKVYVRNLTKSGKVWYDFGKIRDLRNVSWNGGDVKGHLAQGGEMQARFEREDSILDLAAFRLLKVGGNSHGDSGDKAYVRFWSGRTNGGTQMQYVNLDGGDFTSVETDGPEMSSYYSDSYRLVIDGGGHNRDTLDIFIQIHDRLDFKD